MTETLHRAVRAAARNRAAFPTAPASLEGVNLKRRNPLIPLLRAPRARLRLHPGFRRPRPLPPPGKAQSSLDDYAFQLRSKYGLTPDHADITALSHSHTSVQLVRRASPQHYPNTRPAYAADGAHAYFGSFQTGNAAAAGHLSSSAH